MNIAAARLIYFSPTGTTRKVLQHIALGTGLQFGEMDLTIPRDSGTKVIEPDELAILGAPVYTGRLPAAAVDRIRKVHGNGAPAVLVVVYGNRAYEDALLELTDLAVELGYAPVAAAAFIGEHSYSTSHSPVAAGRPDTEDLCRAEAFGESVYTKIAGLQHPGIAPPFAVPGERPYRQRGGLAGIAPVTNEDRCTHCGTCSSVCPTLAITSGDSVDTDAALCIRCCACIKSCPSGARVMEDPRMIEVADRLCATCQARKEPEVFL